MELIYEDEYSQITGDTTKRLIEIIHTIPIYNSPTGIINGSKIPGLGNTFKGTVENFFNQTKDKCQ
jgi:hypothetical protein